MPLLGDVMTTPGIGFERHELTLNTDGVNAPAPSYLSQRDSDPCTRVALGVISGPMSSEVASWVESLTSPPVRWKAMGRPPKSVLRWILHENPPRDRPSA